MAHLLTFPIPMSVTLFVLLVLGAAAFYFMKPDERTRVLKTAATAAHTALRHSLQPVPPADPFEAFLRERARWPIATPLIAAATIAMWIAMTANPSADAAQTLIDWGANYAPRTTNGEWWRLVVAVFLPGGLLTLLVTLAGLVPASLILERLVGRIAFACIYVAAGTAANVTALWTGSPFDVTAGAAGAVLGVYGLFLAFLIWALAQRLPVGIPAAAVKPVAGGAAVFLAYVLFAAPLGRTAELTGFGVGFVMGLVAARGVSLEKPPIIRAALATAAVAVVVAIAAFPLRGIVDFRPEMARMAELESRTAGEYEHALVNFKLGRTPAKALALQIERNIIPQLQQARARLAAQRGVPRQQAHLVEAVEQYVTLREQSWRRRVEGLRASNMKMLRDAEQTERAALTALQRVNTL